MKSNILECYDKEWGIIESNSINMHTGTKVFIPKVTQNAIANDIISSSQEALEIAKEIELSSIYMKGLSIMRLFFVDILGRHTKVAKIFANKYEEDFEVSVSKSPLYRYVVLSLIVILNIGFAPKQLWTRLVIQIYVLMKKGYVTITMNLLKKSKFLSLKNKNFSDISLKF